MAARKKSEEPSINIDEVLTDEELKAVANESEPAERKAKPEDGPRTVVVAEDAYGRHHRCRHYLR